MKIHLRRVDREVKDPIAIRQMLEYSNHFVLSMVNGNEPYAVPLDYVYDDTEEAIYFHGAREGKKIELLNKNPKVWGLVVLDKGFGEGQCVNLYASIMFHGTVEWINDKSTKHRVLSSFAKKANREPEAILQRLNKLMESETAFENVAIGRIKLEDISAKRSTEVTVEKLIEITKKSAS